MLDELEKQRSERYTSAFAIAMIATRLGDLDRGLKWLETAIEDHEGWICFMPTAVYLQPLRSHPRYAEVMHRANF